MNESFDARSLNRERLGPDDRSLDDYGLSNREGRRLVMLILVVGLLAIVALPLLVLAFPLFVWLVIPAAALAVLAIVGALRSQRPLPPLHA
jgi:hypothetical protein